MKTPWPVIEDMTSPPKKPIRLRGHHLICLHFFGGEGYDLEFIRNLTGLIERAAAGEDIEVSSEADGVCRKCPHLKHEKCLYSTDADKEIREMDADALRLLGLRIKDRMRWSDVQTKISLLFPEWAKKYCGQCDWRGACEKRGEFIALYNRAVNSGR